MAAIVQRKHIVAVHHCIFNFQRNGDLKVGNGLRQFTLQCQRVGKLVVRNAARVWRQQGQRLARKFNRVIKLAGVGELLGKRAMPLSATIIRNHLPVARDCGGHVANGFVHQSQVVVVGNRARIQLRGALHLLNALRAVARLVHGRANVEHGVRMIRLRVKNQLINNFRILKFTLGMMLLRRRQSFCQ